MSSLGQRLQNVTNDKVAEPQTPESYESTIRQLKLLSKSQTALLKAYLYGKLMEGEQLVSKTIDILSTNNAKDQRLKDIEVALKNLKLKDIEVDVRSTQVFMHDELSELRAAIDKGPSNASSAPLKSSAPGANSSSTRSDLEKIKSLETETSNLKALLKEAQAELTSLSKANKNAPSAVINNSGDSIASSAQITALEKEIKALKDELQKAKDDCDEKDRTIKMQTRKIEQLSSTVQGDDSKTKTLQADLDQSNKEIAELEAKIVKNQREADNKLKDATKEQEKKLAEREKELKKQQEDRVAEVESRLETEKEEMMEAMAQEIEEIEASKAQEHDELTAAKDSLEKQLAAQKKATRGMTGTIKKLATAARTLAREHAAHKQQTSKQLSEMSKSIKAQCGRDLFDRIKRVNEEIALTTQKYHREMVERKKLHNTIQELKGNIRVFMRCRPPTSKEIEQFGNDAQCVAFGGAGEVKVFNEKNREKLWEFDEAFDTNTTQRQVYDDVSGLVTSVMDGYNVCIFAYGQTGSGKTHTMMGPPSDRGVNMRALEELFAKAHDRAGEWVDTITVSLLEVYNEEIHDLLVERGSSEEKLEVKMGEHGNYVPGLTSRRVNGMQEVLNLIAMADKHRTSATTNMNEHSSRSHMIVTATVISEYLPTNVVTRGKLNLVDLAGSERINKSGATGQALKEAQNINKSLSALGDVIQARAMKQAHVPFRNSTLTFLLQDSISQDSKTLMIVCISPVLYNSEETFCSLNFASRVRSVELGKVSKNTVQGPGSGNNTPQSRMSSNSPGPHRQSIAGVGGKSLPPRR